MVNPEEVLAEIVALEAQAAATAPGKEHPQALAIWSARWYARSVLGCTLPDHACSLELRSPPAPRFYY